MCDRWRKDPESIKACIRDNRNVAITLFREAANPFRLAGDDGGNRVSVRDPDRHWGQASQRRAVAH